MEFQYFKLIFLFVISQQCDLLTLEKSIQISSDGAIITIEQNASDYLIYYMTQENSSVFAAPISTELDLTYQNGFQINFRNVTLIAGDGNVTLSPILQNFLKPINSPETMQDCFEFSLERLILKIFVGGLSFLVILSNGQLTKNTTQSILRSLTLLTGSIFVGSQPERTPSILFCRSLLFSCHRLRDPYLRLVYQQMFCAGHLHLKSRRLSGTGSTVSRSQESFTTRFKTTNI